MPSRQTKQLNAHHVPTLHVVIGPTASGKSEYAVRLAKKCNGEIISADSRQVYIGLNMGAGKVPGVWEKKPLVTSRWPKTKDKKLKAHFVYKDIVHHCIDFISPKKQYSVADFKHDGTKALLDIIVRNKTPIICGGTGQYVDALLIEQSLPEVAPNLKLRAKLEKKTTAQLFIELKKKDPTRAASIDAHNPRRLIRALEIVAHTGKVPEMAKHINLTTYRQHGLELPIKIHYLNPPREELYKKIEKRLVERIREGMIKEIIQLHADGVSWKRLNDLGLEYRAVSQYLRSIPKPSIRSKNDPDSFIISSHFPKLLSEIKHYAKRQQTWFKKYNT